MKSSVLTVALLLGGLGCAVVAVAARRAPPWMNQSFTADERAALLEKRMSVEEKLQLVHGEFALPHFFPGGRLPRGVVGSAGFVPGIARLGVPMLAESDAGLGVTNPLDVRKGDCATALPSGLALAATFDPRRALQAGGMIGEEAWRKGFNVLLAGGIDLARDPRNGRNFEYLGEDPLLAGILDGAAIDGIQRQHVISTIKHYALNDQETHRHEANVLIGDPAMRESDLLAFEIAIENGRPGAVMCSYNLVNGKHACGDRHLLEDVLKGDWGYRGWVMSDWGAVHGVQDASSGLDQESGEQLDKAVYFGEPLQEALRSGGMPQSRLDDMVHRILRSMFAVGVFDHPPTRSPIDYDTDAAVARKVAEEGTVLLKNAGAILPLGQGRLRIAVIGGHADQGVLAGGGSSQVIPCSPDGRYVSVAVGGEGQMAAFNTMVFDPDPPLAAIRASAPNATVRFDTGRYPSAAAALARWADVAIVLTTQWMTEGADAPDLTLPEGQDALIAAVAAANPHTIVVLETGNPVAMPWLGHVAAVAEAWYPGQRGGHAIADVLFGRVNPSGHLPITFPKTLAQEPRPQIPGIDAPAGRQFDVDYRIEGASVGYRWFAREGLEPLFAFGYGLSYTHFAYSGFEVRGGRTLAVSFTVTNAGKRSGDAVPQVYLTSAAGHKELRLIGFSRVSLPPGQSGHVTMMADPRLLADFDESAHAWRIQSGDYTVALARSAEDAVAMGHANLSGRVFRP